MFVSFSTVDSMATETSDSSLELVFQVPVGSGDGKIGVVPSPQGNVPEGPQTLAVDEKGRIYVVDSVGRQILVYKGAKTETISLPFVNYVRDIAVTDGKMFLLDVSDKIFIKKSPSGHFYF